MDTIVVGTLLKYIGIGGGGIGTIMVIGFVWLRLGQKKNESEICELKKGHKAQDKVLYGDDKDGGLVSDVKVIKTHIEWLVKEYKVKNGK